MRIKSAGLPDQWDTKERTEDVEECERLCLVRDRDGDPCRFEFDIKIDKYLIQIVYF